MSKCAGAYDPTALVRDTVQARILAKLFAEKTHDLVLKGGMAMRALYEGARATKDIDLDASPETPMMVVQTLVRRAIKTASAGILDEVVITEPKQTETTMRWKVAGKDPQTHHDIHVTVEISRRSMIDEHEITEPSAITDFSPNIRVYTSEKLALTKLAALLSPMRNAPRDVADLYLLIKADTKPNPVLMRRLFQEANVSAKDLWDKLDGMTTERFRQEVLPSLDPRCHTTTNLLDWEAVRLAVGQTIEQWMRQTQSDEGVAPLDHDQRGGDDLSREHKTMVDHGAGKCRHGGGSL